MEIHVNDDMKLVTVWLTRAEQEDADVREHLKTIYADYKAKKYMVAQFHSGTEDLYRNTRDLLLFNRKRIEELAVQREKQAADLCTQRYHYRFQYPQSAYSVGGIKKQ